DPEDASRHSGLPVSHCNSVKLPDDGLRELPGLPHTKRMHDLVGRIVRLILVAKDMESAAHGKVVHLRRVLVRRSDLAPSFQHAFKNHYLNLCISRQGLSRGWRWLQPRQQEH